MPKIERALISVTDKTAIPDLGKALAELGVEILSTGGTAKALSKNVNSAMPALLNCSNM